MRLAIVLLLGISSMVFAMDRDLDNDGRWDFGAGGTNRDMDNDGRWDFNAGGTDRDIDNDGRWDYDKGGAATVISTTTIVVIDACHDAVTRCASISAIQQRPAGSNLHE